MSFTIFSFGFRYGAPEADEVFDLRCQKFCAYYGAVTAALAADADGHVVAPAALGIQVRLQEQHGQRVVQYGAALLIVQDKIAHRGILTA